MSIVAVDIALDSSGRDSSAQRRRLGMTKRKTFAYIA
jgi:hypothetical protein